MKQLLSILALVAIFATSAFAQRNAAADAKFTATVVKSLSLAGNDLGSFKVAINATRTLPTATNLVWTATGEYNEGITWGTYTGATTIGHVTLHLGTAVPISTLDAINGQATYTVPVTSVDADASATSGDVVFTFNQTVQYTNL